MKNWLTSKTIRVFGAIAIVAVALIAENVFGLDLNTGVELQAAATAAVAAAIGIALRFVTSEGVQL